MASGEGTSEVSEARAVAVVELLGALAYGQLRSFGATARAIGLAPDAATADAVATTAVAEHAAYVRLRDLLAGRTDTPMAAMERQRVAFDAYFDRASFDDWFATSVFFATGLPIAADFAHAVAEVVDAEAAEVIVGALARRDAFERASIDALAAQLTDDVHRDRARSISADLLGRALTGFQAAAAGTDALKVLFAGGAKDPASGEAQVRRLAIAVLGGHRRRVVELGLEELEDIDEG